MLVPVWVLCCIKACSEKRGQWLKLPAPTWETWFAFPVPSFTLTNPWMFCAFVEWHSAECFLPFNLTRNENNKEPYLRRYHQSQTSEWLSDSTCAETFFWMSILFFLTSVNRWLLIDLCASIISYFKAKPLKHFEIFLIASHTLLKHLIHLKYKNNINWNKFKKISIWEGCQLLEGEHIQITEKCHLYLLD